VRGQAHERGEQDEREHDADHDDSPLPTGHDHLEHRERQEEPQERTHLLQRGPPRDPGEDIQHDDDEEGGHDLPRTSEGQTAHRRGHEQEQLRARGQPVHDGVARNVDGERAHSTSRR
jgi:hypothetical protein